MTREILVTVPRIFERGDVLRQLTGCNADRCGGVAWHYCVNRLPPACPSRMHFIHAAEIIGSLPVVGMGPFDGRDLIRADGSRLGMPRRFAIRAAGQWRPQKPAAHMRGFQGFRYLTDELLREAVRRAVCPECGGDDVVLDADGASSPCPLCYPEFPVFPIVRGGPS